MLEDDIVEFHVGETRHRNRVRGARLLLHLENRFEVIQRDFRLAIDVRYVSNFLQRAENEEGVNPAGEELPDRDLAREDQIQHQSQNRCSQRIDTCPLNEAQAAKVLHLFQFELQDLAGGIVQPLDLLLSETEALDELDVPQRLGRRACQSRRLRDDYFLYFLYLPAQY